MERDGTMLLMSMMAAYLPMAALSLLLPVVTYVVARWRMYREGEPVDPHLGLKTVLAFFRVLSYQTMLAGGAVMLAGLFGSSYTREAALRSGAGILVPAALVYFAHRLALLRTNADERPTVVRMFDGISLGLTGVVGFTALLMLGSALLGPGRAPDTSVIWALVLVYETAWVVQALSLASRISASQAARAAREPGPGPASPTAP